MIIFDDLTIFLCWTIIKSNSYHQNVRHLHPELGHRPPIPMMNVIIMIIFFIWPYNCVKPSSKAAVPCCYKKCVEFGLLGTLGGLFRGLVFLVLKIRKMVFDLECPLFWERHFVFLIFSIFLLLIAFFLGLVFEFWKFWKWFWNQNAHFWGGVYFIQFFYFLAPYAFLGFWVL